MHRGFHGYNRCHTHEDCMHAEQIIIIFYIYIFIFCSLYLLLFLIVLYRTIVAVYTDNIFLYNYLWQMHQIIHLSLVGCFTPARGKTVQKNRQVGGVKSIFFLSIEFLCTFSISYETLQYFLYYYCI